MDLYDVVIYRKADGRVDAIAGTELTMTGPRSSVESRVSVVLPRLNDKYDVTHVPTGKYVKGNTLNEPHLDDWTETRKAMAADPRA